jgi:HSP20 family protein
MVKEDKRRRRPLWDDDDFFSEFDEGMEEMRERMERLMEQFMKGELDQTSNPLVYGFSMRVSPDGTPVIQEFGNTSEKDPAGGREPLTDVIEEADRVRVIAEVPGVKKEDIELNATDRSLEIDVSGEDRRFHKHLDLPCDVMPDSAKANYNNGVLEVILKRIPMKAKGKKIRVE